MVPPFDDTTEKVFDLSLMQQQQQQPQNQKEQEQGQLSVAQDRGSSSRSASITKAALIRSGSDDSVPPLDNLTEDTATPEDDSSVSTFGSTVSSSRRSVFSKYWNATGQTPEPVTIRQRSDSCSPMSGQPPLRRSVIFSSSSHGSYNSLPGVLLPQPVSIGRKSVSVGDLSSVSNHRSRGPHKSCLRRDPQYSGENPLRRNTNSFSINEDDILADDSASISSSSVRFDLDATAIRHFKLPEEVHADEGWFNYFH